MLNKILCAILLNASISLALKALFIGNSYTKYNDMPGSVGRFATADDEDLEFVVRTQGGWRLQDHANSLETQDVINSRIWDVVVLQEFSTGLAQTDDVICAESYPYVKQLVDRVRDVNPEAVVQFYLTWGRPDGHADCDINQYVCDFDKMQDRLTDVYTRYACMMRPARVAPVGEAFRRVKLEDGEAAWRSLYVPGDHHPSENGSYMAAASHYTSLFGNAADDNDFVGTGAMIASVAEDLKRNSDSTIGDSDFDWEFSLDSDCYREFCICGENCTGSANRVLGSSLLFIITLLYGLILSQ